MIVSLLGAAMVVPIQSDAWVAAGRGGYGRVGFGGACWHGGWGCGGVSTGTAWLISTPQARAQARATINTKRLSRKNDSILFLIDFILYPPLNLFACKSQLIFFESKI